MTDDKLDQITNLFLEFYPIHQKKIASLFSKSKSDPYKCNLNQVRAIMTIGKNKSIIPTLLGKCLGLQKGSLTTLLDSLEAMELVKRSSHPDDRRKTLLSLTSKGEDYRALKISQFKSELSVLFDGLSHEELDEFILSLSNVLKTLKTL